ncbi:MAG: ABC transporter substrate-binding protein [Defluviitaleaceae bacterium]|nr:ABC transporter substrate-binding protein [Defluviitaleaceae bacterium]
MSKKYLVSSILAATTFLVACGGGGNVTTPSQVGNGNQTTITPPPQETVTVDEILNNPFEVLEQVSSQFATAYNNPNPIIPGGELRVAMPQTAPIPGMFDSLFQISVIDTQIREFTHEPLFVVGMDLNISNTGTIATVEFDRETRTATITKNHVSYWHDGVPVTLDDLVFAHEVIAHPDYTGPRWGNQISNVVGAVEYRNGEADYISGLVLSEDKMQLTIHFIDFPPTMPALGFWSSPSPRHHWAGIAVADMEEHPNARHEALGNGPFILNAMVPGESVSLVRNENYWRGVPNLESVTIEVIDPLMTPMAMQEGMYDIALAFPQSQFTEQFRYMTNVQFLSNPFTNNNNFWLGFRMGSWDAEQGRVVTDETPRISEPVRRAIALAIDHVGAGRELFNGLTVPTGSIYFGLRRMDWIDRSIPTSNNFDPGLARQILDEAGYADIDGDGYRERPDGSPLTIVYAAQTGSPANELNRQLEIQNWRDVGLRVVFWQNRLVETPLFNDMRTNEIDNGEVDFFMIGWNFGANPSPVNLFGPETQNNHTRYTSPEWQAIFDRFESDEMWDEDFLLETVKMWQRAVYDAAVIFPTNAAITLMAVNNRVANFSMELTGDPSVPSFWTTHLWGLTSETPYIDGQ